MYADLEMKAKVPLPKDDGKVKIDGDDVAYGFGLGALVTSAMGSGQAMQSKLCLIVLIPGRIWGQ